MCVFLVHPSIQFMCLFFPYVQVCNHPEIFKRREVASPLYFQSLMAPSLTPKIVNRVRTLDMYTTISAAGTSPIRYRFPVCALLHHGLRVKLPPYKYRDELSLGYSEGDDFSRDAFSTRWDETWLRHKLLHNDLNIFHAAYIHGSLVSDPNSAFGWLPFVDLSPAECAFLVHGSGLHQCLALLVHRHRLERGLAYCRSHMCHPDTPAGDSATGAGTGVRYPTAMVASRALLLVREAQTPLRRWGSGVRIGTFTRAQRLKASREVASTKLHDSMLRNRLIAKDALAEKAIAEYGTADEGRAYYTKAIELPAEREASVNNVEFGLGFGEQERVCVWPDSPQVVRSAFQPAHRCVGRVFMEKVLAPVVDLDVSSGGMRAGLAWDLGLGNHNTWARSVLLGFTTAPFSAKMNHFGAPMAEPMALLGMGWPASYQEIVPEALVRRSRRVEGNLSLQTKSGDRYLLPQAPYTLSPPGLLRPLLEQGYALNNVQVPSFGQLLNDSSKLAILDRLLMNLLRDGHRVLIFSQMTKMIDILEDYMAFKRYKYFRLDGSTTLSERRDMVSTYQRDRSYFAFLLSTRAGGLGINLTSADTVIFYDSDWNPTNDAQAMDRVHRIGQQKQVTVYNMVRMCECVCVCIYIYLSPSHSLHVQNTHAHTGRQELYRGEHPQARSGQIQHPKDCVRWRLHCRPRKLK
jgi:hypothetical protein